MPEGAKRGWCGARCPYRLRTASLQHREMTWHPSLHMTLTLLGFTRVGMGLCVEGESSPFPWALPVYCHNPSSMRACCQPLHPQQSRTCLVPTVVLLTGCSISNNYHHHYFLHNLVPAPCWGGNWGAIILLPPSMHLNHMGQTPPTPPRLMYSLSLAIQVILVWD
jgi:hypothetical protein